MPSGPELFIIALIVLLLFGAKKLPELARGTGRAIREFKDATKEIKSEIDEGEKPLNSEKNVNGEKTVNSEKAVNNK